MWVSLALSICISIILGNSPFFFQGDLGKRDTKGAGLISISYAVYTDTYIYTHYVKSLDIRWSTYDPAEMFLQLYG